MVFRVLGPSRLREAGQGGEGVSALAALIMAKFYTIGLCHQGSRLSRFAASDRKHPGFPTGLPLATAGFRIRKDVMSDKPSPHPGKVANPAGSSVAGPDGTGLLHLRLQADQVSLVLLAEAVGALADAGSWPAEVRFHVDLVLEELVLNIVSYGFPDGRRGHVEVQIRERDGVLLITVEDDGIPFDPFAQAEPDLNLPLEERDIGGLGIHFARSLMDTHSYRREDGRNRVELRKSLGSGEGTG